MTTRLVFPEAKYSFFCRLLPSIGDILSVEESPVGIADIGEADGMYGQLNDKEVLVALIEPDKDEHQSPIQIIKLLPKRGAICYETRRLPQEVTKGIIR